MPDPGAYCRVEASPDPADCAAHGARPLPGVRQADVHPGALLPTVRLRSGGRPGPDRRGGRGRAGRRPADRDGHLRGEPSLKLLLVQILRTLIVATAAIVAAILVHPLAMSFFEDLSAGCGRGHVTARRRR